MSFNPNAHMRKMKSRDGEQDYLDVKWRLCWFRETYPQGTIETEELCVDLDKECSEITTKWNNDAKKYDQVVKTAKGYARFRAIVKTGEGGMATGTKSETAASFPDYVEKAETGAVGRALAMLGFGTQFAPDLNEEHRIVDSPVARSQSNGRQ